MNHNKLKCYNLLLEIAQEMPKLIAQLPKGNCYLVDQLIRAISSAVLNLSEGNGRKSRKEKNRFFDISLASITETSSALDVMEAFRLIPKPTGDDLREKLKLAYAMIFNLKKSTI